MSIWIKKISLVVSVCLISIILACTQGTGKPSPAVTIEPTNSTSTPSTPTLQPVATATDVPIPSPTAAPTATAVPVHPSTTGSARLFPGSLLSSSERIGAESAQSQWLEYLSDVRVVGGLDGAVMDLCEETYGDARIGHVFKSGGDLGKLMPNSIVEWKVTVSPAGRWNEGVLSVGSVRYQCVDIVKYTCL